MRVSRESLEAEAGATGFQPDVLEKVAPPAGPAGLLGRPSLPARQAGPQGRDGVEPLPVRRSQAFGGHRPELRGGCKQGGHAGRTPINGGSDGRPSFRREDFEVRYVPQGYAGGKWPLRYAASSGQGGVVEVDLNFMYRLPLWPEAPMDSHTVGRWQARGIPVVDIHELAAGKAGCTPGPPQGQGPVRQQARVLPRRAGPRSAQDGLRGLRCDEPEGLAYCVRR